MSTTVDGNTDVKSATPTKSVDVPQLGRLERVDPRMAWPDESSSFAPWLATGDNLVFLSETVGLDLEVLPPEQGGASCRAGVVCRDVRSNVRVLVQLQVEVTDHVHLGEMIADAAALEVGQVVWVAENFADTHRATLEWLNKVTGGAIAWRGVEVQVWRIDDSMAPRFSVVVRPDARGPGVTSSDTQDELTPLKQDQLAFWSKLRERLQDSDHSLKVPEARPDYAMRFPLGRTGFQLEVAALFGNHDRLWAAVKLTGPQAKQQFQQLMLQRAEVEADLEELVDDELVWDEYPRAEQTSYIYLQRKPAGLGDRGTWDGHVDWLDQSLEGLVKAFGERITKLP